MPQSEPVQKIRRFQDGRQPVRPAAAAPPTTWLSHTQQPASPHTVGGLFARQQEKIRQRNHQARFEALRGKGAQAVAAKGRPLPPGSVVLQLGVVPTLFEMVHAALPEALQTNKVNYALLAEELAPDRLAAKAARFVGAGEYVLPVLKGSSATWSYQCRVRVSLDLAEQPSRVTDLAKAGMGHAWSSNSGLTQSHGRTTGPTFTASGAAGTQMGLGLPGGTANAGVAYKRETTTGFSHNSGHERSDNFTYPEGATVFDTHADLRVRIEWDKRPRALAAWARGQAHKELTMDGLGWSSSDGATAKLQDFQDVFASVPITYAAPSALTGPHSTAGGRDTPDDHAVWV
ncbi:hypothetical protein [Streptomyces sp. WZ-12]|uniref:hypothetical protein n=1 Tax=Streptomyces sp. WZ-12 TaxID=3030210 RepID=UPI00238188B5|nr:hypothetical protein [Streptomyces sp. WZ-12]